MTEAPGEWAERAKTAPTTVGELASRRHAPVVAEEGVMDGSVALTPSTATGTGSAPGRVSADTLLSGLLVVLIGLQREVYLSLGIGTLAALAFTPLWWPAISRFRGGRLLFALGAGSLVAGAWLTEIASADHRTSTRLAASVLLLVVNVLVGVGVLLWARLRMTTANVAVLYGLGLLLGFTPGERYAENPWRFGLSVPLTFLALALAWKTGKRWLEITTTLLFAALIGVAGGRSTFAMLLLTALLLAWQGSTARTRTGSRARVALFAVALVFAVYQVGQGLILDGYLGEGAQQRTQAQIDASGSVLLGARPEVGAALALARESPLGFGAGTRPNLADVSTAKAGMASLGYDPDNGYVESYMFGTGFELHSVIGDSWALYGLLGAGFALVIVGSTASSITALIAQRAAPALLVFLAIRTLWNLLFSPLYSSVPFLVAALGLLLPLALMARRDRATARAGADPVRDRTP